MLMSEDGKESQPSNLYKKHSNKKTFFFVLFYFKYFLKNVKQSYNTPMEEQGGEEV
jgi:hypothetical protein